MANALYPSNVLPGLTLALIARPMNESSNTTFGPGKIFGIQKIDVFNPIAGYPYRFDHAPFSNK
jgi:hypothetical protein